MTSTSSTWWVIYDSMGLRASRIQPPICAYQAVGPFQVASGSRTGLGLSAGSTQSAVQSKTELSTPSSLSSWFGRQDTSGFARSYLAAKQATRTDKPRLGNEPGASVKRALASGAWAFAPAARRAQHLCSSAAGRYWRHSRPCQCSTGTGSACWAPVLTPSRISEPVTLRSLGNTVWSLILPVHSICLRRVCRCQWPLHDSALRGSSFQRIIRVRLSNLALSLLAANPDSAIVPVVEPAVASHSLLLRLI